MVFSLPVTDDIQFEGSPLIVFEEPFMPSEDGGIYTECVDVMVLEDSLIEPDEQVMVVINTESL